MLIRRAVLIGLATVALSATAAAGPVPPAKPPGFAAASAAYSPLSSAWRPLSAKDEGLYRQIFSLQRVGRWTDASRLIRQLDDQMLMGHVRFQRLMHPTRYRATYDELHQWMDQYSDHPGAYRVFALAKRRQPEGMEGLVLPVHGKEHLRQFLGEEQKAPPSPAATNRELAAPILSLISRGRLQEAEAAIKASPLAAGPSDFLRARTAFAYLLRKQPEAAFKLAAWAANRSRDETSLPDWVAGLAAYQLKRFKESAKHFGLHAQSRHASDWNASAGAYWAARALTRSGQDKQARRWLLIGAQYRYTFYGQLARERLGLSAPAGWEPVRAGKADLKTIKGLDGGMRALALAQVGEIRRADEELLQYLGSAGADLTGSIIRVAGHLRLPQAAVRGSYRLLTGFSQEPPPAALYPQPDWQPSEGKTVDEALLWAFVRQESVFNPNATSSAGARGLMQLMPSTANYIAGEKRFDGSARDYLYEPPTNLELGQRYLRYLMRKGHVGRDLFRLLTAYNAGVGNLRRWEKSGILAKDPLMFIETLPPLETRLFVERVMANLWAYRQRMGQPAPSLQQLANDRWPQYAAIDNSGVELARDQSRAHR